MNCRYHPPHCGQDAVDRKNSRTQLLYSGDRYSCAKAALESSINDVAFENPNTRFFMVKAPLEIDRRADP